jgi:hypothetical protein
MVQNRNKLIELFVGNLSNSIVHQILERAVSKELMADKYRKELVASFEVAKRYREKINPVNRSLSYKDLAYIRKKIINRVRAELMTRVSKGYKNIDLSLIEEFVDGVLKDADVG